MTRSGAMMGHAEPVGSCSPAQRMRKAPSMMPANSSIGFEPRRACVASWIQPLCDQGIGDVVAATLQ